MSTCKAGPCESFGRIRRRHREASCRRSKTTRHAACRFPRSCRASSQTTKPSATRMDWYFLPKRAHLCGTVTGRRDVFDPAVEALGLKITPHNLRDTAASLAIQEGASVVAVARLLGHESAATTLNHYAGLFPTDLDDIASRLDVAARLTITSQSASSDAKKSPTKHRPEKSKIRTQIPASHHSPAKTPVPPAGFEPAPPALGEPCSIP